LKDETYANVTNWFIFPFVAFGVTANHSTTSNSSILYIAAYLQLNNGNQDLYTLEITHLFSNHSPRDLEKFQPEDFGQVAEANFRD